MASAAQGRGSPPGTRVVHVALVAAAIVALAGTVSRRRRHAVSFRTDAGNVRRTATGDLQLSTSGLLFELIARTHPNEDVGDLRVVRDVHGEVLDGVAVRAVVDGAPAAMTVDRLLPKADGPMHATAHALLSVAGESLEAELDYTLSRSPPGLTISLRLGPGKPHALALSLVTPLADRAAFVPGSGLMADAGEARGRSVILEDIPRAAVITAPHGEVSLHLASAAEDVPGLPLMATITSPDATGNEAAMLLVAPTSSLASAADVVARVRHEPGRPVRGHVLGGGTGGGGRGGAAGSAGVDVWAIGADGKPILHLVPEPDGSFEVAAPFTELLWYATTAHTRASPMVARGANDQAPLELTVLPGGEVHVAIRDADTLELLTARLIAHGLPPTADPNFGPDYRSSGAGPLIDALRGEATVPLPTGRYRLLATRGPEYTIDEQTIEVPPGSTQSALLLLRHVIATPGSVGCDFHVHARPSFDSPVLPEDRVLSLVAAGVDFAVPSEHNVIGHYGPALEALGLTSQLAHVPGVEITTRDPRHGHFNIFPFTGPKIPPYKRVSLKEIFAKARDGDPLRVLQVNHPRLARDLGYFDLVGLDTKTGRAEKGEWRDDFDTLEVYNGFEGATRARTELVLRDWLQLLAGGHRYVATGDSDSHRIQFQWAGYPRTYVTMSPEQAGDTGAPIDTVALIAALKAGRAFVTSGPMLDAQIDGAGPGATVVSSESMVKLHLRVRAAPWIDVDEVEVLLGTTTLRRIAVPSRPTSTGHSQGDLATAQRETVRFEQDIDVPVPSEGGFVVAIARGSRPIDDVLPYTAIQPMGFTNPIWLRRR